MNMPIDPVIHHHFQVHPAFFVRPWDFKDVPFRVIPFFKLYDIRDLRRVRDVVELLSRTGTSYQAIFKELRPLPQVEDNHYRKDLVTLECCTFNQQKFFTRCYRFYSKEFFKIETSLHSDTIGQGKYLYFESAYQSATRFFNRLEENTTPLHPLGRHLPEYFFFQYLQKEVSAWKNDLLHLKEAKKSDTRKYLKERLVCAIQDFQNNAKEIGRNHILSLQAAVACGANFASSHQLETTCD